jgi:hypothetical protein
MASVMAATVWDRLQDKALTAVRGGADNRSTSDGDLAARQLLASAGGNRRIVLATRLRLAASAAGAPTALESRRALALLDRAIALADVEALWHPVFSELDVWEFARDNAAP